MARLKKGAMNVRMTLKTKIDTATGMDVEVEEDPKDEAQSDAESR